MVEDVFVFILTSLMILIISSYVLITLSSIVLSIVITVKYIKHYMNDKEELSDILDECFYMVCLSFIPIVNIKNTILILTALISEENENE